VFKKSKQPFKKNKAVIVLETRKIFTSKRTLAKKIVAIVMVLGLGFMAMFLLGACTGGDDGDVEDRASFYTLRQAFNLGLITEEDVKSIADGSWREVQSAVLCDFIEAEIKWDWLINRNLNIGEARLLRYHGSYNGSVAVVMGDTRQRTTIVRLVTVRVAGIDFTWEHRSPIRIWKSNRS
jgi:hypothetical protein